MGLIAEGHFTRVSTLRCRSRKLRRRTACSRSVEHFGKIVLNP